MKIKSIAPWFGGKRTLAPDIVRELGKHTQYFEPFCGALAVLFAKEPSQKETVNDIHGDVINLARCLSCTRAEELWDTLREVVFCEAILNDARDYLEGTGIPDYPGHVSAHMLKRAKWYFLASWMGRNGTAGTERVDYQIAVRWTKSGGSPTVRFRNAVDSIPAWHRRLLNVVILDRDAFSILNRFEDVPETAIYVDSPYPEETRGNIKGASGARYLHEFNHSAEELFGEKDDHLRLRDALMEYQKARIVVSSYDCDRYRKLYDGWTFVSKTMNKQLHAQNGRGARQKDAPEVLIINGPSYAEAA